MAVEELLGGGCDTVIYDPARGTRICSETGEVIEENVVSDSLYDNIPRPRNGKRGQGSQWGVWRRRPENEREAAIHRLISEAVSRLGLPSWAVETARRTATCLAKGLQGRVEARLLASIALASAVYAHGVPVKLADIYRVLGVRRHGASSLFRWLLGPNRVGLVLSCIPKADPTMFKRRIHLMIDVLAEELGVDRLGVARAHQLAEDKRVRLALVGRTAEVAAAALLAAVSDAPMANLAAAAGIRMRFLYALRKRIEKLGLAGAKRKKKQHNEYARLGVLVPKELAEKVEELVREGRYSSKGEVVREALKAFLSSCNSPSPVDGG